MTDKLLKKLNGDYEKEIVEQTFSHRIYLNSEDLCSIFDIEYDVGIRWNMSYKESEENSLINLKVTKGDQILLDKEYEDPYNSGRTVFEIAVINYVEQVLGYDIDRYHHYDKKVILRNAQQRTTTEELVLVYWRTVERFE